MDELEFRRRVYANPDSQDKELIAAAQADATKQAFWQDIKQLDRQLQGAIDIPVPDDLANKLILRQRLTDFQQLKRRNRWYLSLAASVAFVCGIGFTMWWTQPLDLNSEALAHMQHAMQEQQASASLVNLQHVNAKMAQFGGQFTAQLGDVISANYCHLNRIKTLHLIVAGDNGPVSVFVVPHSEDTEYGSHFANDQYQGTSFSLQQAQVLIVGEHANDLSKMEQQVRERLTFSA